MLYSMLHGNVFATWKLNLSKDLKNTKLVDFVKILSPQQLTRLERY